MGLVVVVIGISPAVAVPPPALLTTENAPIVPERSLGKADAPIVVEDFSSLTCSHCATFYLKILPELKTRYIDTGKVRFLMRDFPLDGVALRASALSYCMPEEQYFPFVKILFENMEKWVLDKDPQQILGQYAKLGGLAEERAKACMNDAMMIDALVSARTIAQEKHNIQGTPTFVVNGGEEVIMGHNVDDFAEVFERLLAEKEKKNPTNDAAVDTKKN